MAHKLLDGELFSRAVIYARDHLNQHKQEVDALNVFPVPDGDTGTNMLLTLTSAAECLAGRQGVPLCEAAELASHGALMGARGNSGVILSQIFRGISRYFAGKDRVPARELAAALEEAVSTAYKAVMKPVEGTILTVLRAVRDGALEAASRAEATLEDILQLGLRRGREALARTPEMLPVLKQAGVVDAGGKGLIYIIEGMLLSLNEASALEAPSPAENVPGYVSSGKIAGEDSPDITFPYDTQFLLRGSNLPLDEIRRRLESFGDSLLVVGSQELARVHIHTDRPGDVLTLCLGYGSLSQVTIDNMIEQAQAAREQILGAAVGAQFQARVDAQAFVNPGDASKRYAGTPKEMGIVSVATGRGFKEIMTSLGCDLVIDGGNTMNPSTSELASAVKSVNARKIVFLPNNSNIFLAAKQAKKIVGRSMYIVPSRTIPQGISALMALNPNEDMSHNLKRAAKAIKRVKTGEVTFAARNGKFGKYVMKQGDILGLIDGKVEVIGTSPEEVLVSLVKSMAKDRVEVVTVYYGQEVSPETAEGVFEKLRQELSNSVELELHEGGQPLYYYIVSAE